MRDKPQSSARAGRGRRWSGRLTAAGAIAIAIGVLGIPAAASAATALSPDGWSRGVITSSSLSVNRVVDGSGNCHHRSSYVLYGAQGGTTTARLETSQSCPASAGPVGIPANYAMKVCTNIANGPDSCSGWVFP